MLQFGLMLVIGAVTNGRPATAATPKRIVSLNLCTDQLVLLLAPERVAAVSALADDPLLSVVAEQARHFVRVRGDAEEVLRLDPDLVVAAPFAARATVDLLRQVGRRVFVAETGQDIDGLKRALRDLAREIGASGKAEALIADLDARLVASAPLLQPSSGDRPGALVINFGGLPSGPGSLADTALTRAGFRNSAVDYPVNAMGAIPLEAIVARPPDLLVLGQDPTDYRSVRGDNLRHPALMTLLRMTAHVSLPQRLTLCATPAIADAIALLAAQRADVGGRAERRAP